MPEGFIGIDIKPSPAVAILADVTVGIPLPDGCASEIRLSHVLEHIAECDKAIEEVDRLCQPGAKILIVVPDVQHESYHIPTHCQPWSRYWFQHHLALWILESIEEVVDQEGLSVARKYLPDITEQDAMLLFWNVRKELKVTCRKR